MKLTCAYRAESGNLGSIPDFALFNLAIDRKLRGCGLTRRKVVDVIASAQIKELALVLCDRSLRNGANTTLAYCGCNIWCPYL